MLTGATEDRWWRLVDERLAAVELELDRRVPGFRHGRTTPSSVGSRVTAYVSPDIDLPPDDERPVVLIEVQHGNGKVLASMHQVVTTTPPATDIPLDEIDRDVRAFLEQNLDVMASMLEVRRSLGEAGRDWSPR